MPNSQLRILVVEHDNSTTVTLARLLRRDGHEVSCAETGNEAIALSGLADPDDLERSRVMGFGRHITKPAGWDEVRGAVRTLCPRSIATPTILLLPEAGREAVL